MQPGRREGNEEYVTATNSGNHAFRHGEDRQSDGGIGKAQGQDAAEPSFFRSEEIGKAKSDPLGTAGAHNGSVDFNGVIVLGRMKFQHHLASHRNALACAHAAPSERQVRQYPFDDDAPARIADGANLRRIFN